MSESPAVADVGSTDTAVCCSGGGIRSASYCLGALQALAAAERMRPVGQVTAVSGGSYIAAAWALAAEHAVQAAAASPSADHERATQPAAPAPRTDPDRHPRPGQPSPRRTPAQQRDQYRGRYQAAYRAAFRPGSAEESRLRDHTHYLVPDAAQALRGLMSLLWGALGNLLLITSLAYVVLGLDGWLLQVIGGISWAVQPGTLAPSVSVTPLQVWIPAGLAAAAVLLFVIGRWPQRPHDRRGADRAPTDQLSSWTAALVALAAAATAFLVAGPALFAMAWHVHWISSGMNGMNSQSRIPSTATTLSLYAVGLLTVAKGAAGTISAGWSRLGTGGQGIIRPWLVKAGQILMPWLGSALIVVGLLTWAIYILGVSTRPGFPRWHIAIAAAIFLALHVALDVNRTSLHDFYRDRLASGYCDRAMNATRVSQLQDAVPGLTVCAAANLSSGRIRSYHRGSALQPSGSGQDPARYQASRLQHGVPPGRGAVSWIFTPTETGLHFPNEHEGQEMAPTEAYEALLGPDRMTLFDVVADSGAAFSPLMGKATSAAHRLLLAAVNLRLGVWLPRPALVRLIHDEVERADRRVGRAGWRHALQQESLHGWLTGRWLSWQLSAWEKVYRQHSSRIRGAPGGLGNTARRDATADRGSAMAAALRWRLWQPNLLLLWREAAGRNPVGDKWIYVTDGGGYDNLGLVEALRCRPRVVYVLDASGDPEHSYRSLGQAIALARSELGVEISIDPSQMELPPGASPDGQGQASGFLPGPRPPQVRQPFVSGTFRYVGAQAGQDGEIAMIKLGVWAGQDLPWDVRAYYAANPTFPRASTLQQLYDDEDFEAYRELGAASMRALLASRAHRHTADQRTADKAPRASGKAPRADRPAAAPAAG